MTSGQITVIALLELGLAVFLSIALTLKEYYNPRSRDEAESKRQERLAQGGVNRKSQEFTDRSINLIYELSQRYGEWVGLLLGWALFVTILYLAMMTLTAIFLIFFLA